MNAVNAERLMFKLASISLSDYLTWKNVNFSFEPGVTVINGQNKSGKTVLFRASEQAIWGNLAAKRGTDAAKIPSGAAVEVAFSIDDKLWRIRATSSKVALRHGDKDLKMSGKKAPLERLRNLAPISRELYAATVHLNGPKPHALVESSSLARLEWFSAALGVDELYDELEGRARLLWQQAKEAEAHCATTRSVLRDLGPPPTMSLKEIEAEEKKAEEIVNSSRKNLAQLTTAQELFRTLDSLPKLDDAAKNVSIDDINERLGKATKKLEALRSQEQAYASYLRESKTRDDLKYRLKKIRRAIRSTGITDLDEAKRAADILRRVVETLNERCRTWQKEESYRAKLTSKPARLVESHRVDETLHECAHVMRDHMKRLGRSAKLGATCDECGQTVSDTHRNHVVGSYAPKIVEAATTYQIARESRRYFDVVSKITIKAKPADPTHLKEAAKAFIESIARYHTLIVKEKETERSLRDLPEIEKVAPVDRSEIETLRTKIDKLRELRDSAVRVQTSAQTRADVEMRLKKMGLFTLRHTLSDQATKASEFIEKYSKKQIEMAALAATERQRADQRKRLAEALKDHRVMAKRVAVFNELKEAFGKKGLRVQVLSRFLTAFENELNDLAALAWSDGSHFTVNVSESGVDILLTRNGATSDLSTLSGAEDKVFKVITCIALLRILPPRLRCDTIILDEIESNSDPHTRRTICTTLIDELKLVVPKIVMISPLPREELPVEASRRYRVKVSGKTSVLVRE